MLSAVPVAAHVRRARDLVDRRFAEPLDLDAMAGAAGFSRYHFARVFRAAYGETPRAYLTRRRIERAQDYLRTRSCPRAVSSSYRSRPNARTGSRPSCGTTRATGSASRSARSEAEDFSPAR